MSRHYQIPSAPQFRVSPGLTAERSGGFRPQPRTVTHSQIFWLNMTVGFTSTANEITTGFTEPEGFDSIVRASWSDLRNARVRFVETETDRSWSVPQIPIRSISGASDQAQPLVPLPDPVYLEARAQIRGDWLNSGTEAAGRVCFYSELAGMDGQLKVKHAQGFWLMCNLGAAVSTTDPSNDDILIWGATTNVPVTIIGRVFNETTNFAWSSQQIPLRAMAGVDGQVQPIMRWHRPYLLPANVKLRAEINTATTGGYLAFWCEKILA
jgi:hypothetical protein